MGYRRTLGRVQWHPDREREQRRIHSIQDGLAEARRATRESGTFQPFGPAAAVLTHSAECSLWRREWLPELGSNQRPTD